MKRSRTFILIIQREEEEEDNQSIKNHFHFLKYFMLIIIGHNLSVEMQISTRKFKAVPTPQLRFG